MLFLLLACKPDAVDLQPTWGYDRLQSTDCRLPERPSNPDATLTLEEVFPDVNPLQAVAMVQAPGDPESWYLAQRGGLLRKISVTSGAAETVLDITDRVLTRSSELGFLGITFHPDWPAVPELYISYTTENDAGMFSRISRIPYREGAFLKEEEEVLIEIDQPYENHNGGGINFGPDGFLYAGYGDGGSAGDPFKNGQNTDVLLGKMLRIDVENGSPYTIPADNPFAAGGGAPEIYAWGLRNPWRWSFDRSTGELWVGDVGQNEWEEVDRVERGGNYGWNTREGAHCYRTTNCETAGLIDPLAEYNHNGSKASIVGGYVYRGSEIPSLQGTYLYMDTYTGIMYGLSGNPTTGAWESRAMLEVPGQYIVSFAEALNGDLFVLDYVGKIYKIAGVEQEVVVDFPNLLSQTGCVDPTDPKKAADGLLYYDVNLPLWSDGLSKSRWLAFPENGEVGVSELGDLDLPIGTVLVKEFAHEGLPVETRLLARHDDGSWGGYSYAWRADGSDAELLSASSSKDMGDSSWSFPSRAECMICHTEPAGRSLGLELRQLAGPVDYPNGAQVDQIEQWIHLGLLPEGTMSIAYSLTTGTVEQRARGYLQSNCAMCHQPGSTGGGGMDLRYDVPLADAGLCDVLPERGDLGVADARLLAPGAPERSILSLRMHSTDVNRMPPIGTEVIDEAGIAAVEAWVSELSGCP